MLKRLRNSRLALALGLITAASFSFAPNGAQGTRFADKAGNMEIVGIKNLKLMPKENAFRASGTLRGTWKSQGLTLEAKTIEGKLKVEGNSRTLLKGTLGGGVEVTAVRNSSNPASNQKQTVNIKSTTATYDGNGQIVQADGGIDMHSSDPGAEQELDASGSSGTVNLTEMGSKAGVVSSAVLKGPVKMKMRGKAETTENGKTTRAPFFIDGRGDRMEYSSTARTIVLTGNVHIDGDHPSIMGSIDAIKAIITLSATGDVESLEFEGEPGRTVYEEKKSGGGGGR